MAKNVIYPLGEKLPLNRFNGNFSFDMYKFLLTAQ